MAVTRNVPCPCGSGRKYKQCCQPVDALVHLHDQAQAALDADDAARALDLAAALFRDGWPLIDRPVIQELLAESIDTYCLLLQDAGRGDEALAVQAQMAAVDVVHRPHWLQVLGLSLIRAGRRAEGLAKCEEGLRLAPHVPDRYVNLAHAQANVGQWTLAMATARAGIAIADQLNARGEPDGPPPRQRCSLG